MNEYSQPKPEIRPEENLAPASAQPEANAGADRETLIAEQQEHAVAAERQAEADAEQIGEIHELLANPGESIPTLSQEQRSRAESIIAKIAKTKRGFPEAITNATPTVIVRTVLEFARIMVKGGIPSDPSTKIEPEIQEPSSEVLTHLSSDPDAYMNCLENASTFLTAPDLSKFIDEALRRNNPQRGTIFNVKVIYDPSAKRASIDRPGSNRLNVQVINLAHPEALIRGDFGW